MPSLTSALGLLAAAGLVDRVGAQRSSHLDARQMSTTTCADVHVFLAKGNNEPYPGRQSKLVTAICDGLASCDYEDIVMNNMLADPYCDSVYQGATNGVSQIEAYYQRCPDAQLVVSGYSQGAHVVGDVLGGGGGTFFQGCVQEPTAGLNRDSGGGSKTILTFGDTRHTANQPYNIETGAAFDGIFPRTAGMITNLDKFATVWHDYCVSTDPICAGGDNGTTHVLYFERFTNEAAGFVRGLVTANTAISTATSATSTSTNTGLSATTSSSTSLPATTTSTSAAMTASASSSASERATTSEITEPSSTVTLSTSVLSMSALPEATASTTENLSFTPTASATGSATSATTATTTTGSNGAKSSQRDVSLFGLAVAGAFALLLV